MKMTDDAAPCKHHCKSGECRDVFFVVSLRWLVCGSVVFHGVFGRERDECARREQLVALSDQHTPKIFGKSA